MYLAIAFGSRLQTRIARAWSDCSNGAGKLGLGVGEVIWTSTKSSSLIGRQGRKKAGPAELERRVGTTE
jgi:hypothetical protein